MTLSNWARLEARYYMVELADLTLRKLLNLAFEFLLDAVAGSDEWETKWAPIFSDEEQTDSDYVDLPTAAPGQLSIDGV